MPLNHIAGRIAVVDSTAITLKGMSDKFKTMFKPKKKFTTSDVETAKEDIQHFLTLIDTISHENISDPDIRSRLHNSITKIHSISDSLSNNLGMDSKKAQNLAKQALDESIQVTYISNDVEAIHDGYIKSLEDILKKLRSSLGLYVQMHGELDEEELKSKGLDKKGWNDQELVEHLEDENTKLNTGSSDIDGIVSQYRECIAKTKAEIQRRQDVWEKVQPLTMITSNKPMKASLSNYFDVTDSLWNTIRGGIHKSGKRAEEYWRLVDEALDWINCYSAGVVKGNFSLVHDGAEGNRSVDKVRNPEFDDAFEARKENSGVNPVRKNPVQDNETKVKPTSMRDITSPESLAEMESDIPGFDRIPEDQQKKLLSMSPEEIEELAEEEATKQNDKSARERAYILNQIKNRILSNS